MKLKRAVIENFKGLKGPLEIDFTSFSFKSPEPVPRTLTCLIGDNGSGKTTILQAIALTLSLATARTRDPSSFNWHGFLAERVASLGPSRVELVVSFDEVEIELTRELAVAWLNHQEIAAAYGMPGALREVTLVYEKEKLSSPQGDEAITQLRGRHFANALALTQPSRRTLLTSLGDVFWFQQARDIGSIVPDQSANGVASPPTTENWKAGVERLREYLVGMWGYHTSPMRRSGKDYIELLERRFSELFPGTRFLGIEPRLNIPIPRPNDFYFLLERDGKVYDLAEMSSGEQAAFPLIYEFVLLDIAKSIVLIDELELHLHPPGQQALLGMLRRIGPDCQFIITTHSPFLEEAIPDEHEVRLPGGRRCL